MLALLLPQLLNPKNILIGVGSLFIMWLLWSGERFEKNYINLQKQTVALEESVTTYQTALSQEKKTADTEAIIAQTTINSVEKKNQQDLEQVSILNSDNEALQLLRKPTYEDNKCVTSPYVSTILNRLRRRASDDNSVSSSSSDAHTTSVINSPSTPATSAF